MNTAIPSNEFVADTMGLVLRLEGRSMPDRVRATFDTMEAGQGIIYIPGLAFAEILYLSEKQRIRTTLRHVDTYLGKYPQCRPYPLTFEVIQAAAVITDIPELHDRVIAGTARLLNLPLITNDPAITGNLRLVRYRVYELCTR